jgi:hypothetical protein
MRQAVKGWCQLLNRSVEVAENGVKFAEDTQFWMKCLSNPNKYSVEQLEGYLESVREEVKTTKQKVKEYNQSLHTNRTEITRVSSPSSTIRLQSKE